MKKTEFKIRHVIISRVQYGYVGEVEFSMRVPSQFTACHFGVEIMCKTFLKLVFWLIVRSFQEFRRIKKNGK